MHARLIRVLALAALVSWTACGRSENAPAVAGASAAPADTASPTGASASLKGVDGAASGRHGGLPASFPRDILIPDGLVAKTVQSEHAGSYIALFTGDLEPEAVYQYFSEHLAAEGWSIDKAHGAGPEYGIFARKDERITTVISTRIDGQLHVELGVYGGS
jgi:hypothetical protein